MMSLEQQNKLMEFSKILNQLDPQSKEYKAIIRMITDGYDTINYFPPRFTSISNNIIYTAKIEYKQYRSKSKGKGKRGEIFLHQITLNWMRNKMHLNVDEWQEHHYFYKRLIVKK